MDSDFRDELQQTNVQMHFPKIEDGISLLLMLNYIRPKAGRISFVELVFSIKISLDFALGAVSMCDASFHISMHAIL